VAEFEHQFPIRHLAMLVRERDDICELTDIQIRVPP